MQVKSSVLGVGNLLLSWSPISNTNVTYSLSVADPAAPVTVLFTFGPITKPQLAYKYPATGAWCTRYLFTVMAMNEAGDSDPSQPVIASAPTGMYMTILRQRPTECEAIGGYTPQL